MRYLLVLALACFATPVFAGDFDYEAEAALALASSKQKPKQTSAPCEFCKAKGCDCNNCGCDSFHQKAGAVPAASTFQGCASPTGLVGAKQHAGHDCPSCGYQSYPGTFQVRGPGPVPGTHFHACPKCGTTWFH